MYRAAKQSEPVAVKIAHLEGKGGGMGGQVGDLLDEINAEEMSEGDDDMMDDGEESPRKMLAVRFKDDKKDSDGFAAPKIAVFDVALLYEGIIEMIEGNAWRGDRFSDELDKHFTILQND